MLEKTGPAGNVAVYVRNVTPDSEIYYDGRFHRDGDIFRRPESFSAAIRVKYAWVFDVNEKPFCYIFWGPRIAYSREKRGVRVGTLCCEDAIALYDDDGDGIFEKLTHYPHFPKFDLYLPAWILHNSPGQTD